MRILVYTRNFLPDLGGLERNTLTLASTLARMGHEPTVLTETLEEADRPFPFKTVRSRDRRIFFDLIKEADLVLVNGGMAMKICSMSWLLGKPFVPVYQMASVFLRDGNSFFSKQTRRFMASRARMSVAVSHHAAGELRRLLPGHVAAALPNPIDTELGEIAARKAGQVSEKEFDLLFVGRLIDGKGIFHLVEATASLRPKLNLKIAFAGEGEDLEKLLARIRELKLDATYIGRLDREQLIGAYLKSKALVVPSSTHTEGLPLVIAEALSVGLPVVASDQPAMVEAVGEAGLVFKRGSAEDLAAKLEALFSGNLLKEKTAMTASRRSEFSMETYEKRLADILKKSAQTRV